MSNNYYEEYKDLVDSAMALTQSLDESQYKLMVEFLTNYSVSLTDHDLPNTAKSITTMAEILHIARKKQ